MEEKEEEEAIYMERDSIRMKKEHFRGTTINSYDANNKSKMWPLQPRESPAASSKRFLRPTSRSEAEAKR